MALPKVTAPTYELELPSNGKKIRYRPFLVKEEKVLLIAMDSKDQKQISNAVIDVLNACIVTRGVKLQNLASFDLEYLFSRVRAASVGEVITMNVTCQDDGETQVSYDININDIEVTKPEGHENKIMLSDKVGIIMKYPGIDTFIENSFDTGAEIDAIKIIAASIDQIFDGEEITEASDCKPAELTSFLDSLTQVQFGEITKFFETMPKLSHTFKVTNPNTGVESEYTIEGLQSFFA